MRQNPKKLIRTVHIPVAFAKATDKVKPMHGVNNDPQYKFATEFATYINMPLFSTYLLKIAPL